MVFTNKLASLAVFSSGALKLLLQIKKEACIPVLLSIFWSFQLLPLVCSNTSILSKIESPKQQANSQRPAQSKVMSKGALDFCFFNDSPQICGKFVFDTEGFLLPKIPIIWYLTVAFGSQPQCSSARPVNQNCWLIA